MDNMTGSSTGQATAVGMASEKKTIEPVTDGKTLELSWVRTASLGSYVVALNLVLVYLTVKFWPGSLPAGQHDTIFLVWGKRWGVDVWIETRYLVLVALTGALGSYIHLATSFADYLGNRKFVVSWTWWYILRPFIGISLAEVLYFVVRGGLLSGNTGASTLNVYGIAAVAGMAGLFSTQATDKLREVFEDLFRTREAVKRADPLPTEASKS